MEITHATTNGLAVETGPYMHEMVRRYHRDMLPYAHLSVTEVYDLIKSLPYRADPETVETLMRPAYTMNMKGFGGDCDDKCIALACYCLNAGIPFEFVAVRRADKPSLHHVLCELYIDGKWVDADPTYNFCELGRGRENYVQRVILPPTTRSSHARK